MPKAANETKVTGGSRADMLGAKRLWQCLCRARHSGEGFLGTFLNVVTQRPFITAWVEISRATHNKASERMQPLPGKTACNLTQPRCPVLTLNFFSRPNSGSFAHSRGTSLVSNICLYYSEASIRQKPSICSSPALDVVRLMAQTLTLQQAPRQNLESSASSINPFTAAFS